MTAPRVLNISAGATEGGVYIGRACRGISGSKWGNPFRMGRHCDRAKAIERFRAWLMTQPDLIEAARIELRGRDLVCWCAPLPCHGDVLLEVANG